MAQLPAASAKKDTPESTPPRKAVTRKDSRNKPHRADRADGGRDSRPHRSTPKRDDDARPRAVPKDVERQE